MIKTLFAWLMYPRLRREAGRRGLRAKPPRLKYHEDSF